jgi:hypothetical protein
MPTFTYRFTTHWVTTDQEVTGYIERYEVQPNEIIEIENGALPNEVLQIVDPVNDLVE